MKVVQYNPNNHLKIISEIVDELKKGKIVAYPTDTSYGLAVDSTNAEAIQRLYRAKERGLSKPVHVITPSIDYTKSILQWDERAQKLADTFWPGPLTIILPLKSDDRGLQMLSAGTGTLGARMPNNKIALDLARELGRPITTTSANPSLHLSGGYDSYTGDDVVKQFQNKDFQPDIVLDAGELPKQKPSTMLKLTAGGFEILREGPVTRDQIQSVLADLKL